MPQHFLRSRKAGSDPSPTIRQPLNCDQPQHKGTKPISPRTAPTTRDNDESNEQSPQFTGYYTRTPILDASGDRLPLDFECSVSRGFFKIKEDWVCYRRNYISVMAVLKPPNKHSVFAQVPLSDRLTKIRHFAFLVAAVTAADPPRAVDMIQLSAKRDKGPQTNPEFVQISAPSLKAEWSRLQYKVATANNGKKRGQQYFALKVTLLGWIESESNDSGTWLELGDKYSEPMIVRGRSPGHYNDTDSSCNDAPPSPPISPGTSESDSESPRFGTVPKQPPSEACKTRQPRAVWNTPESTNDNAEWPAKQPVRHTPYPIDFNETHFENTASTRVTSRRQSAPVPKWQENSQPVTLPPIQMDCECSNSRPRLPTYDELSSQSCRTLPSLPSFKLAPSAELQAALSLAAISHTSPLNNPPCRNDSAEAKPVSEVRTSGYRLKRQAGDVLVSSKSSKSSTSPSSKTGKVEKISH